MGVASKNETVGIQTRMNDEICEINQEDSQANFLGEDIEFEGRNADIKQKQKKTKDGEIIE